MQEKMSSWLETRQFLYSQLDYPEITPLNMPADVVEWLNMEVGTPAQALENTPYPIWRVREPENYNLEKIRTFLAPYALTAYQGEDFWHEKDGRMWSLIITPRVPIAVIEKLNHELGVIGKETHDTPCFVWAVNLDDAEKLLVEVRKLLEEYLVIPHLVHDLVSQQSSKGTEIIEEYFPQRSIGVAPTANKFDLMRFYKIDGVNYGLFTETIIKEMMLLDKQYGVDFIGPADIQLRRFPEREELSELENWFQDFVPDLAYEDEVIEDLQAGQISLWWD